jgi:hypothetical protein
MPRYATIVTADDGAEIVSAIAEFEGTDLPRHNVEQVVPGVRIGIDQIKPHVVVGAACFAAGLLVGALL